LQEFRSYRMKRRHIPASILQYSILQHSILQFSSAPVPVLPAPESFASQEPGVQGSGRDPFSLILQLLNSCNS
jgi:hypothetical protein